MEFINLLLSSFWHFVGLMIFTSAFLVSIVKIIRHVIALLTITFRGYPPEHCDAVGEKYEEKSTSNSTNDKNNQTEIQ